MKLLPFDTETSGFPLWKKPSEIPGQPHIVQLAALLVNADTEEVIDSMDEIIKPDGWVISDESIEVHGITQEQAMDVGIPETEALQMFLDLHDQCGLRIAHNTTFDNRIVRIAMKRYQPNVIPDEIWKDKSRYYCTLINAKKIMGGKSGHALKEAYLYFTGKDLENAHTAMGDAKACMEIYFAMKECM